MVAVAPQGGSAMLAVHVKTNTITDIHRCRHREEKLPSFEFMACVVVILKGLHSMTTLNAFRDDRAMVALTVVAHERHSPKVPDQRSTEHSSRAENSHDDVTLKLSHTPRVQDSGAYVPPPARWKPPLPAELQARLPQFEVTRLLGHGGMGAVYEARQISLDRPVALKILPPELGADDHQFVGRFQNEARAMAKLNHPGIVNVHDFGESTDGLLYIIMEFVEGTDMAQMIAAKGCLPAAEAVPPLLRVCEALHYAHERGVVHRDIKPSNILIDKNGTVKVADFGLAKVRAADQSQFTTSQAAMGTLHFIAPEAFVPGMAVDRRADVFAVGVMLYQMLTGRLPQGMFALPSSLVAGLDVRYDEIVSKAMQDDRAQRHQSAEDLRQELEQVLTQAAPADAETGHGVGWFL